MKSINSLISKHGRIIQIDDALVKAFIDESKSSQLKARTRVNPYINTKTILTKKKIPLNANITMLGKAYRVFEVINEIYRKKILVYTETKLFEDTFVNDVSFHKQSIMKQGCNLPSVDDKAYVSTKAQITTKNHNDTIQYSMHTNKPSTHVFTVFYEDNILHNDLIKWGDRNFEILHSENVDEKNVILVIEVIEVL